MPFPLPLSLPLPAPTSSSMDYVDCSEVSLHRKVATNTLTFHPNQKTIEIRRYGLTCDNCPHSQTPFGCCLSICRADEVWRVWVEHESWHRRGIRPFLNYIKGNTLPYFNWRGVRVPSNPPQCIHLLQHIVLRLMGRHLSHP